MADTKKYYWLKLKRDFFKRHDIKIIESMENGKDYVLFYMKLLLESIDHEGELRFSETIPYNEKMLATITDTNIDIVRSAVKIFSELGMMEQMDDGTLYMAQVSAMVGSETSDAVRMRRIRQEKKQILIEQEKGEHCSETFKNRSPELEKDIEKDIEKENIITEKKPFSFSPTDEPISVRFEKHRKSWNYYGLPGGRFMFVNMPPDDAGAIKAVYSVYTDDEIETAIQNYNTVTTDPAYDLPEKYRYKTFLAFLKKGIVQYVDDANPLVAKLIDSNTEQPASQKGGYVWTGNELSEGEENADSE